MATKTKSPKLSGDTYMSLLLRFPLKPLKNDTQHDRATAIIGDLLGQKLDAGASDYLDTLLLLVNKYEDDHHTPMGTNLTPQEALRAIMHANNLSQSDIARIIGSESAVSMFLSGSRELSKSQIKALTQKFHVDASLFL